MKKQFIAICILAFSIFACGTNENKKADLSPKDELKIQTVQINEKRLASIEKQVGIEQYTNIDSKKTWQELDAFYASMPAKAQELKIEKEYLDILQHNLIVSMVTNCRFLESNNEKIAFYAKEFERLGAEHTDVAGAFYAKVKNTLPENAIPLLRAKSQNFNAQNFETVKATIEKNRTK